jgi:hypothetical protein
MSYRESARKKRPRFVTSAGMKSAAFCTLAGNKLLVVAPYRNAADRFGAKEQSRIWAKLRCYFLFDDLAVRLPIVLLISLLNRHLE